MQVAMSDGNDVEDRSEEQPWWNQGEEKTTNKKTINKE